MVMPVRRILTIDKYEKLLRSKSQPVKQINKEIKALIRDIKDTISDPSIPANGLAAPQIGILKRVFGVRLGYVDEDSDETLSPPLIFINPEIIEEQPEVVRDFEGCLSIPGMMGNTDRKLKIKVRYTDEKGKRVVQDFEGWDARVVQHELDHLNGILYLDRLESKADLYVWVRDDKGELEAVPYLDVIRDAATPTEDTSGSKLRLPGVKTRSQAK
jgi:peptide deformylase